jgi:Bacterial Ig domain
MRRYLAAVLTAVMLVGLLPLQALAGTAQEITFTSTAPTDAVVGGATYGVAATSDSGLTVEFSIDDTSLGACTLNGTSSTVSFDHAGTCVVSANQAGDGTFDPAPQVQQAFAVGQGDQMITFTSTEPAAAHVGGTGYEVTATGGASGNDIMFGIDPTASAVCSISGSTISFDHVGTCIVTANQAGNADWNAAVQVQQSFAVGKGDQAIEFTSTAPSAAVVGGATYDPTATATATSSQPVVLAIDASSLGACTLSGATVSFVHPGTCTIDANQSGDADWNAAPEAQQTFAVGKGDQVVSFATAAPDSPIVGQTYDVSATATSGLEVVLSIDPASAPICTIAGGTVTFTAVGGCHINAGQAGDAGWNAATSEQVVGVGDVAPVCPGAPVSVVMNVAKSGSAGCTDHELDALAYSIVADAAHGKASIDAAGTWTYVPALNYRGPDSFTFTANDGVLDSAAATITITVTNLPLDARNDGVPFVRPLDATVINVLANDSPGAGEAGQPLTITTVSNGAKGRVTTNGATVSYDPNGCSAGADTFTYTVSDGQYSATKTVFVTIARPGQNGMSSNPVTDTPALGFITNSTIGSTVPARLSWCGITRSGYSVRSYTVGQSTNGGTSYASKAIISGTKATSSTRNLSVNTTYRWRARTIDSASRVGSYRYSLTARVTRYQDSSTAITYSPGWKTSSTSSASGGAERYASAKQASATITLTNVRQFAIVGPRSSTRGSFEVWVDGSKVATVSERAGTTVYRRVLYVRGLTSGAGISHTVRIVAVGNGRIDLDAILALF